MLKRYFYLVISFFALTLSMHVRAHICSENLAKLYSSGRSVANRTISPIRNQSHRLFTNYMDFVDRHINLLRNLPASSLDALNVLAHRMQGALKKTFNFTIEAAGFLYYWQKHPHEITPQIKRELKLKWQDTRELFVREYEKFGVWAKSLGEKSLREENLDRYLLDQNISLDEDKYSELVYDKINHALENKLRHHQLDFSLAEKNLLLSKVAQNATPENYSILRSMINFYPSLSSKERELFLDNFEMAFHWKTTYRLQNIFASQSAESLFTRFAKVRKITQKQRRREVKMAMAQLKMDPSFSDQSWDDLTRRAVRSSENFIQQYEKRVFACESTLKTQAKIETGKKFQILFNVIGNTVSFNRLLDANRDEDRGTASLARQFGLGFVMRLIKNKISASIFSREGLSGAARMGHSFVASRMLSLADVMAFSAFFQNEDQQRLDQGLDHLTYLLLQAKKGDEEALKILQEKAKLLDNPRLMGELNQAILSVSHELLSLLGKTDDFVPHEYSDFGWDELTVNDLSNPIVIESLVQAASLEVYEEAHAGSLSTGDPGVDRYMFNSGYSLASLLVGKKYFVEYKLLYQTLCYEAQRPVRAYLKALIYFLAQSYAFDDFYYSLRNSMVRQ